MDENTQELEQELGLDIEESMEDSSIAAVEIEEVSIEEDLVESTIPNTEFDDSAEYNLEPESRVGVAIYLAAMNTGIMTEAGVILPAAVNMTQIAKQAEVSVNYAIKAMSNIRKMGFIKNRKEDGRLLFKLDELEEWLQSKGMVVNE